MSNNRPRFDGRTTSISIWDAEREELRPDVPPRERATRSSDSLPFDLLPPGFLEAAALRMGVGAETHGWRNYQKGDSKYIETSFGHTLAHAVKAMKGSPDGDDDLVALACNALILWWHREHNRKAYDEAIERLK